jgi:hypothetical protein
LAVVEHGDVVGERERVLHVLLDEQECGTFVADLLQRPVHLVDDNGREPE